MVSIDGKKHSGYVRVKYGESFIRPKRSTKLTNEYYGLVLVYVIQVGVPEWNDDYSVRVPIKYLITEVIEPGKEYLKDKRKKKLGLKIIE